MLEPRIFFETLKVLYLARNETSVEYEFLQALCLVRIVASNHYQDVRSIFALLFGLDALPPKPSCLNFALMD